MLSLFIALLFIFIPLIYTQVIANRNPLLGPLNPPECGLSNSTFHRIIGGQPARLGAWPWMTALGYVSANPARPNWGCGGSLITAYHVLTAAHCILTGLYIVRIGDLNLDDNNDGATPFEDNIKHMEVHPYFDINKHVNDIAIVRIFKRVPFTSVLHPICLPYDNRNRFRNLDNLYGVVAGWGRTSFGGWPSNQLLQVQVPITTELQCKRAYPAMEIDQRVLCAGAAGRSTCKYDSGGPLMLPGIDNPQVYYVFGIVAYAYKCAEPGYPTVFTRVTSFINYIIINSIY